MVLNSNPPKELLRVLSDIDDPSYILFWEDMKTQDITSIECVNLGIQFEYIDGKYVLSTNHDYFLDVERHLTLQKEAPCLVGLQRYLVLCSRTEDEILLIPTANNDGFYILDVDPTRLFARPRNKNVRITSVQGETYGQVL